jgi:ribulose-5-phosphate 4-epimerase/fuculose-1-phosphate aldolase
MGEAETSSVSRGEGRLRPDVQSVVHVHPRFIVLLSVLGTPLVPMRQEGIHLVRHPLPVYPHVKTIQSDAEGMEVARLLGDGSASTPTPTLPRRWGGS